MRAKKKRPAVHKRIEKEEWGLIVRYVNKHAPIGAGLIFISSSRQATHA